MSDVSPGWVVVEHDVTTCPTSNTCPQHKFTLSSARRRDRQGHTKLQGHVTSSLVNVTSSLVKTRSVELRGRARSGSQKREGVVYDSHYVPNFPTEPPPNHRARSSTEGSLHDIARSISRLVDPPPVPQHVPINDFTVRTRRNTIHGDISPVSGYDDENTLSDENTSGPLNYSRALEDKRLVSPKLVRAGTLSPSLIQEQGRRSKGRANSLPRNGSLSRGGRLPGEELVFSTLHVNPPPSLPPHSPNTYENTPMSSSQPALQPKRSQLSRRKEEKILNTDINHYLWRVSFPEKEEVKIQHKPLVPRHKKPPVSPGENDPRSPVFPRPHYDSMPVPARSPILPPLNRSPGSSNEYVIRNITSPPPLPPKSKHSQLLSPKSNHSQCLSPTSTRHINDSPQSGTFLTNSKRQKMLNRIHAPGLSPQFKLESPPPLPPKHHLKNLRRSSKELDTIMQSLEKSLTESITKFNAIGDTFDFESRTSPTDIAKCRQMIIGASPFKPERPKRDTLKKFKTRNYYLRQGFYYNFDLKSPSRFLSEPCLKSIDWEHKPNWTKETLRNSSECLIFGPKPQQKLRSASEVPTGAKYRSDKARPLTIHIDKIYSDYGIPNISEHNFSDDYEVFGDSANSTPPYRRSRFYSFTDSMNGYVGNGSSYTSWDAIVSRPINKSLSSSLIDMSSTAIKSVKGLSSSVTNLVNKSKKKFSITRPINKIFTRGSSLSRSSKERKDSI